MTEKELEKLFKTKLGSASYEYNPAAWNAMENLLDQKATRGGPYFWRSAAAILLFGLLSASVTFWQNNPVQDITPVVSSPGTESPSMIESPVISIEEEIIPVKAISKEAKSDSYVPEKSETQDALPTREASQPPAIPAPASPDRSAIPTTTLVENNSTGLLRDEQDIAMVDLSVKAPRMGTTSPPVGLTRTVPVLPAQKTGIRQGLYLKGGTVLNESYNTGDMGVGFHLGFEYQLGIARNLDLIAGLNYSRINKLGIHQQYDSTFYHFSSERIETEITGRQLNYLEFPLSINWRFHPRHQIGLGGYAAVLLSVSEDVETRHYAQGHEMSVSKSVDEGKLTPYKDYDIGLGCQYFFMVDRQLELGLELRYGLTDITKDLENVYTRNHQNLNTRISLRYRLI